MAANAPIKRSPYIKEWIAHADPPKEANTNRKMNGRLLLLSLNKTTNYFKEWTTANGVLKKVYFLYKSLMLQIDLVSSSCSQKLQ